MLARIAYVKSYNFPSQVSLPTLRRSRHILSTDYSDKAVLGLADRFFDGVRRRESDVKWHIMYIFGFRKRKFIWYDASVSRPISQIVVHENYGHDIVHIIARDLVVASSALLLLYAVELPHNSFTLAVAPWLQCVGAPHRRSELTFFWSSWLFSSLWNVLADVCNSLFLFLFFVSLLPPLLVVSVVKEVLHTPSPCLFYSSSKEVCVLYHGVYIPVWTKNGCSPFRHEACCSYFAFDTWSSNWKVCLYRYWCSNWTLTPLWAADARARRRSSMNRQTNLVSAVRKRLTMRTCLVPLKESLVRLGTGHFR